MFEKKCVLVYGFSKSGRAATELLLKKGAKVLIYDDKEVNGDIPIGARIVSDLKCAITEADLIVISPAVPYNHSLLEQARLAGKQVVGELELAYNFCDCGLIAITGTNGKTTTTLLINEILNRSGRTSYALGNIGIPFSEKVLELSQSDTAVLEVSSFQLESTKYFSPDISVILNIAPDHLDRHKNFEEYIAAKSKIFKNQINRDITILNADDEIVKQIALACTSEKFYFSTEGKVRGAYIEDGEIFFEDTGKIFIIKVDEVLLKGRHNMENVLASVVASIVNGVAPEIIRVVLKSFIAPKYRNEYLGEKQGKRFFNDSKGTNIAATKASIESMNGNTVLILGGSEKGENFAEFFKNISKKIVHIFVTGGNSPKIIESAITQGFYNISYRSTLVECVRESACVHASNVLFSPASASFDNYRDYRERGEVFARIFSELK